jgi:hypothetical protein
MWRGMMLFKLIVVESDGKESILDEFEVREVTDAIVRRTLARELFIRDPFITNIYLWESEKQYWGKDTQTLNYERKKLGITL